MPRVRFRSSPIVAVLLVAGLAGGLAACTDPGDPQDEELIPVISDLTTTTALQVVLEDVTGRSFCDVADEMAAAVQVYSDPSANLGDPSDTKDVYVGAYVAFNALAQVVGREVKDGTVLLEQTLKDAVDAASEVDWDVTRVTGDVLSGTDPAAVATALAQLRTYTLQRCNIDLVEPTPPVTATPTETPEERQRRVIEDTFPQLAGAALACVEAGLPLEFDPAAEDFDPQTVLDVFAGCGIDPQRPGAPTSSSEPPSTDSGG